MSVEILVFFKPANLVTASQWKHAILSLGYDVVIDEDIDMMTFSGFLPVMHRENKSGFEYYYDELGCDELCEIGIPSEYQSSVTLRTGGNFDDLACSSAAISALCQATDGIIVEPQESVQFGSRECVEWGKNEYNNAIALIGQHPKRRKMTAVEYIDRFVPLAFLVTGAIRRLAGLTSASSRRRR